MDNNNYLEKTKNIIRTKEKEISKSQIRVNILEASTKRLEKQKINIKKRWRIKLSEILFNVNYNIIISLILIGYLMSVINIFEITSIVKKSLSVMTIYMGVLTISLIGAYTASKVKNILRIRTNNKNIVMERKIENNKQQIIEELSLQESLKKEVTLILDELDITAKQQESQERINYINESVDYQEEAYLEEVDEIPYIRRKKRY